MALVSPGVEVTVIDESNYIPAATNSVPYILVATAQNKISGTGVGVAAGTLAANAGRVYLITSQRDLAATFGNPFFYKTSAGTPINGYELNEYGLLAAFSSLGISNRAYVQRADIDLAELTASLARPTGAPNDGTYWLDTASTSWGIFQWNQSTARFGVQTPIVITDAADVVGSGDFTPLQSVGNIGDYAVVTVNANNPVYYKNNSNVWVQVGTDAWKRSWATVQGAESVLAPLTAGNTISINGFPVIVPPSPNNTVSGLAAAINAASIAGITAETNTTLTGNKLWIYADSDSTKDGSTFVGGIVSIDASGSTAGLLTALGITAGDYLAPALQQSPNFQVPPWRTGQAEPRPTGSVWNQTTAVNLGTNIVVRRYDAALGIFNVQAAPVYADDAAANRALDPAGGGRNIPAGSTYVQFNTDPEPISNGYNNTFTLKVFERLVSGPTIITGDNTAPVFVNATSFTIQYSVNTSSTLSTPATATISGTDPAAFLTAVSSALPPGAPVTASVGANGAIVFTHTQGGVIVLRDVTGTPVEAAGFDTGVEGVRAGLDGDLILSNWVALDYTASAVAPDQDPASGRLWYYSALDQVDIMIQNGGAWVGYQTVTNDIRGFNLSQTNPTGPIISATAPTLQTDGTPLVQGDLWVDTSDLENYPRLRRWQEVNGSLEWVLIENTDQTTENGVLFADARWAPNGTTDPITAPIPTIQSLLSSSYLDPDAPNASLYPTGMLLWNTRRSGFNVKSFQVNYFNAQNFPGETLPAETNAWVTASGNRADGAPYTGRKAQRELIVRALKQAIDTQDTLREEQIQFNLLACPQYPELMPNMVALNNERSNTGFVVGDTPLRLAPTGTDITAWATNTAADVLDSEAALTTADPYMGVFYPSCQTTDLTGSPVVQPASHMMLRTIIRNDEVAFPWLAPAGVRRGVVDNAERLGYVNAQTGEFVTIATGQGLRDVLYTNRINPITFIPGVGITNYGNKTTTSIASALDRINVARLVAFLRGRLEEIGKTFVFEPNDQITRNEITNAIDGLMIDLVAKRGIYDYLIVCDLSNNTPARIDRNELWVDIAIEPVKAVEFIYIPLRIKNTGEISSGQVPPSQSV
jgi:hypothetical protein